MEIPSSVAKWAFAGSWTAGLCGVALVRYVVARDPTWVSRLTPLWSRGCARAWGVEVRAHGASHVDPAATYIFMCNHQSYVDIVALFEALPVQPGFLAKKELRRIPFLGRAMEIGGHVFIDRSDRGRAIAAITEAAGQVREGASIVVFPEGTRSADPVIGPLKKGPFHLARRAGVAVVPVGVRGSARILAKNGARVHPGPVDVHIGPPIPPEVVCETDLESLMERVRREIGALADMPLL